jgi:hypothetical protein
MGLKHANRIEATLATSADKLTVCATSAERELQARDDEDLDRLFDHVNNDSLFIIYNL